MLAHLRTTDPGEGGFESSILTWKPERFECIQLSKVLSQLEGYIIFDDWVPKISKNKSLSVE
jgi:hypothetical protein